MKPTESFESHLKIIGWLPILTLGYFWNDFLFGILKIAKIVNYCKYTLLMKAEKAIRTARAGAGGTRGRTAGGSRATTSAFRGDHLSMGQNLMGTFWEDYHLLKGFLGSWGVRGFDPLPPHEFYLLAPKASKKRKVLFLERELCGLEIFSW